MQHQRLRGHVHHPPAFGAEVELVPIFVSGNFSLHDKLHLGVQAFQLQRTLERSYPATLASGDIEYVIARSVYSIARHDELRRPFQSLLVELCHKGLQFCFRLHFLQRVQGELVGRVDASLGEVCNAGNLRIVFRSGCKDNTIGRNVVIFS